VIGDVCGDFVFDVLEGVVDCFCVVLEVFVDLFV